VEDLLSAIYSRKRSILLTGMPGSGKTCTLLAVQEALELRAKCDSALVPMFIQSREFADLATARDREAQGLCEDWVERVARLADKAHIVIVVDSLDVLSISREHAALTYFLAQIDRLLLIENVTVLTACRDFDRRYDRRLAARVWESELACQPLDLTVKFCRCFSHLILTLQESMVPDACAHPKSPTAHREAETAKAHRG